MVGEPRKLRSGRRGERDPLDQLGERLRILRDLRLKRSDCPCDLGWVTTRLREQPDYEFIHSPGELAHRYVRRHAFGQTFMEVALEYVFRLTIRSTSDPHGGEREAGDDLGGEPPDRSPFVLGERIRISRSQQTASAEPILFSTEREADHPGSEVSAAAVSGKPQSGPRRQRKGG